MLRVLSAIQNPQPQSIITTSDDRKEVVTDGTPQPKPDLD
jgi:hypothetical protein